MHRLSPIFLLILLPLTWTHAQDGATPFCGTRASFPPRLARTSATADGPGGIYITSSGTLRILLVFASFPDDTTPNP